MLHYSLIITDSHTKETYKPSQRYHCKESARSVADAIERDTMGVCKVQVVALQAGNFGYDDHIIKR